MDLKEFQELSNKYQNGEERNQLKQFLIAPPIHPNKKTIVFSTPSETGTSYFRILEPAFAFMRHYAEEFNIIYTEGVLPLHFTIADIIVMHRADQRHSKLIDVAKKWPRNRKTPLIIHDVDDNEFNLAKNHSMKDLWYAFEKDKHSLYAVKNSDYIITTGKGLKNAFTKYNPNVKIFRNYFNWNLPQWNMWDKQKEYQEKYKGKVVIGYCGLSSHQDDIRKLAKAWKIIHDKYPQAHFIVSGIVKVDVMYNLTRNPDGSVQTNESKVTDPTQTYMGRVKKLFEDFDQDRIEYQDSKGLEDYGEFYSQYDINCTFVEQNAFNSCKSDIKLIEGLHYGSIPVFSNWGPYQITYENMPKEVRNDNFICHTENDTEWARKIGYWIDNQEEGKRLASIMKTYTDDITDMDKHIAEKVEYLNQVLDKHTEEQINKTSQYIDLKIN